MLEEAKIEKRQVPKEIAHTYNTRKWTRAYKKNNTVENPKKIESIFVVQNYIMIVYIIFVEQLLLLTLFQ